MCRLSWDTYMRNACSLRRALLFVDLAPLGPYPAPDPGVLYPEGGLVGGNLRMGCRPSYNKWRPWQGRRYAHSHWGSALQHGVKEAAFTEGHGHCVIRSRKRCPGGSGVPEGRDSVRATGRPGTSAGRALALNKAVWGSCNVCCHVLGRGMCRLS